MSVLSLGNRRERHSSLEERCQKILPVATIRAAMSQKRGQKEDKNHKHLIPSPLSKNAGIYTQGEQLTQAFAIASEGWMCFPCLLFLKPKEGQNEIAGDQKHPETGERKLVEFFMHLLIL